MELKTPSMASVKIILRNKPNKDGTHSLALQIIKNRVSSITHLGHSIEKRHWDPDAGRVRKSHPNSKRLNTFLLKKLAESEDKLLELETQKKDTSSKAITRHIKKEGDNSFFSLAAVYLDNLQKRGKYNRVVSEEPRINHFREFLKERDITFQEITVTLLNRFRAYLSSVRGVSERTIINHLMIIRTVFNLAIKSNLVDAKHYPFGKEKVPIKFPDSIKIGLNPEEVKIIEELDLAEEPKMNHARNIWLFSFYFAGMRVSDVLRVTWDDFQDMRLHYSMGKNLKAGSLKTPEKALLILSQYENRKGAYKTVFPDLDSVTDLNNLYEVQRITSYSVKRLNKWLKKVAEKAKIEKKMTLHISRHTFGNISGDRIPIQMLQKLYRHSSITTTIGYQANFIHKDADDALESVINL